MPWPVYVGIVTSHVQELLLIVMTYRWEYAGSWQVELALICRRIPPRWPLVSSSFYACALSQKSEVPILPAAVHRRSYSSSNVLGYDVRILFIDCRSRLWWRSVAGSAPRTPRTQIAIVNPSLHFNLLGACSAHHDRCFFGVLCECAIMYRRSIVSIGVSVCSKCIHWLFFFELDVATVSFSGNVIVKAHR